MATSKSMTMKAVLLLSLVLNSAAFTFLPSRGVSSRALSSSFLQSTETPLHGTDSLFLPIDQLNSRSFSPIAVPLLGMYPGVATSTYLGKDGSCICNPGEWSMTFENCDPTMGGMGMACVEGAPTMYNRPDGEFVGMIANGKELGVPLPRDDIEVLVVVDKSIKINPDRRFYVVNEGGQLKVKGGQGGEPCLGEVIMVKVPWVEEFGGKRSGFSEEEEYF